MGKTPKLKIVPELDAAIREIARLEQKHAKLEQRIAGLGNTSERASRKAKRGHEAAASSLVKYAAGFLTVQAAVRGVTALVRDMRRELEQATQRTREQEMPLARLAQVSTAGRPLAMLIAEAQKTRLETGMPLEQAAALQFTLESGGLGAERPWMAQLFPMIDPAAMTEAVGAVTAGFGREEVGTPREVSHKLITAARRSKLTAADFAGVIGGMGPAFREVGGREEEALALVAAGSKAVGGEAGATAMARLVTFIAGQERYVGKGVFGALAEIDRETAGMTSVQFKEFMPELRARKGFGLYKANRELIIDILAEVDRPTARDDDAVSAIIREAGAIPELFGPAEERKAKEKRRRAEETNRPVLAQQMANAVTDRIIGEQEEEGQGYWGRLASRTWIGARRITTFKENEARDLAEAYGRGADLADKLETAVAEGAREGTGGPTLNQVRDYGDRK